MLTLKLRKFSNASESLAWFPACIEDSIPEGTYSFIMFLPPSVPKVRLQLLTSLQANQLGSHMIHNFLGIRRSAAIEACSVGAPSSSSTALQLLLRRRSMVQKSSTIDPSNIYHQIRSCPAPSKDPSSTFRLQYLSFRSSHSSENAPACHCTFCIRDISRTSSPRLGAWRSRDVPGTRGPVDRLFLQTVERTFKSFFICCARCSSWS